jgi:hypothetical protein
MEQTAIAGGTVPPALAGRYADLEVVVVGVRVLVGRGGYVGGRAAVA